MTKPMDISISRQMYRRYARGELSRDELAKFVSGIATETSKELINDITYNTNRLFYAAVALFLHDKYGFGKKRLLEVSHYMEDVLDSYSKGLISIEDMEDTLKQECKFELIVEKEDADC